MRNMAESMPIEAVQDNGDAGPHPLEEFYRRLGHLAISRHGTLWCDAGRFSLVTIPSNERVAATKRQIQQLLIDTGKWVALFCPTAGSGPIVSEYLLESRDYGLHSLQRQFRSHVRRHGAEFHCRELSWEEMANRAGVIHADLAVRWKQASPYGEAADRWDEVWASANATPGLFAYGCLHQEELAGYVVARQQRDNCHGILLHRNSRFDAKRSGNVLLYNFSAAALRRPGIRSIHMGRSWFPPKPSLDRFKRHAGYEERRTPMAVVIHPRLEPILCSRSIQSSLRLLSRLSRNRLDFEQDIHLFQAARRTEITSG